MNSNRSNTSFCPFPPPPLPFLRFYLAVFGSILSSIAIIENSVLLITLVKHKNYRSNELYLIFLALFDLTLAFEYIWLGSLIRFMAFYNNFFLLKFWMSFVIPMLALSAVCITASTFLILAASVEQYLVTVRSNLAERFKKFRLYICLSTIIFGVTIDGSVVFEYQVIHLPQCSGTIAEHTLTLSSLSNNKAYDKIWRFWLRNLGTIFLPYFALAFFNVRTILRLRQHKNQSSDNSKKVRKREVTRTFVLITLTYLVSNAFTVALTLWEHIDLKNVLRFRQLFYFTADMEAILRVVACMLALPICCFCKADIRRSLIRNIDCRSYFTRKQSSFYNMPFLLLKWPTSVNLRHPTTTIACPISSTEAEIEGSVINSDISDCSSDVWL